MTDLRKDPVIDRWVIIASERGNRPSDFQRQRPARPSGGFCPFCAGNEYTTPPEIMAFRDGSTSPNQAGWSLRVVPNKFPALHIEGALGRAGEGMFDRMNGVGAHEVIIETPEHEKSLSTLSLKEVEDVVRAYRIRIADLEKDERLRYALVFKNQGATAGASLEHSHSQLIALPVVPEMVRHEMAGAKEHYLDKERCVYCDIIRQELDHEERVITKSELFLSLAPFAPRFPFETWILPRKHCSSFHLSPEDHYAALAEILQDTLRRIDRALEEPDYNYILHTAPLRQDPSDFYHWHIEIIPKLSRIAGFEWGSGFFINTTPPEEGAEILRKAL